LRIDIPVPGEELFAHTTQVNRGFLMRCRSMQMIMFPLTLPFHHHPSSVPCAIHVSRLFSRAKMR
jgi:hypothetical protein